MRPSLNHAGQQTTEPCTAWDFEAFCQRQKDRARGRASAVLVRYRERIRLAREDDAGDEELVEVRGAPQVEHRNSRMGAK